MATVNVTLSLGSTDLFAKQTLSFTETDVLSPAGDQQLIGRIKTTGSGTKDNIATKALDGTDDRAYLFLHNTSTTTGEFVDVGLCSAHGSDSVAADVFAVLGPGEFLFLPISDMQDIDLEPDTGTPVVEYILMEKA
jgi:hypothetical protein